MKQAGEESDDVGREVAVIHKKIRGQLLSQAWVVLSTSNIGIAVPAAAVQELERPLREAFSDQQDYNERCACNNCFRVAEHSSGCRFVTPLSISNTC